MLNRKIKGDAIVFYDGAASILTIHEKEIENGVLLEFVGELRSDVAHDVLDELVALATVGMNIKADLGAVAYITPSTQQVFLQLQHEIDKMGKGSLVLTKLSDTVRSEFDKVGMLEVLMIEE